MSVHSTLIPFTISNYLFTFPLQIVLLAVQSRSVNNIQILNVHQIRYTLALMKGSCEFNARSRFVNFAFKESSNLRFGKQEKGLFQKSLLPLVDSLISNQVNTQFFVAISHFSMSLPSSGCPSMPLKYCCMWIRTFYDRSYARILLCKRKVT